MFSLTDKTGKSSKLEYGTHSEFVNLVRRRNDETYAVCSDYGGMIYIYDLVDLRVRHEFKLEESFEKAQLEFQASKIKLQQTQVELTQREQDSEQLNEENELLKNLSNLANELDKKSKKNISNHIRNIISLSPDISRYSLKKVMLLASISLANQHLENWEAAKKVHQQSEELFSSVTSMTGRTPKRIFHILREPVKAKLIVERDAKKAKILTGKFSRYFGFPIKTK